MAQFRDYLIREGVPFEEPVQLSLEIRPNAAHLAKPLYVPSVVTYHQAAKGQCVLLDVLPSAVVAHTTQKVEIIGSSSQRNIHRERAEAELHKQIPQASLESVNWENIHLQLLEYKQEKGFHNLIFDIQILKRILSPDEELYKLSVMEESEVVPTSLAELARLEELVLTLLRKYVAKFYGIIQKRWNEKSVQLKPLDETTPTSRIGPCTFREKRRVN